MPIAADTLAKLAQFDTPTVSNAIELFHVVPRNRGYMDQRIKAIFPELPSMIGFAATAAFRSDAAPPGGDVYGSMEKQVEQFGDLPGPAVVVFQDLDDPSVSATFGEVMCSTFRGFGSMGLITSGTGRDIEQIRPLKYPVFARGRCCSHAYCHIMHVGLPVHVGGLTVNNGDLLHGDANGVIRVPLEIATEIPGVAAEFATAERIILDYVQPTGPKQAAELAKRRKEFAAVVAKLTERVRRTR